MGWFSGKKDEADRLLEKRTERGGLVFWVKDASMVQGPDGAINGAYVNQLLQIHVKSLPMSWLVAVATADTELDRMSVKIHPTAGGAAEIHVDTSKMGPAS